MQLFKCFSDFRCFDPFRRYSRSNAKVVRNHAEFWTCFALPKFVGYRFQNYGPHYYPGHKPHPLVRFGEVTPITPKVIGAHMWNFKPKFKCPPSKFLGGPRPGLWCVLTSLGQSLARLKFEGSALLRAEIQSPEKVETHISYVLDSDQSSPDLFRRTLEESFSIACFSDFGYLESFPRYSRSKSEVE